MLERTLRSFRHRNYRLFFAGQFVSMTGTWMQQTAQMWLVYRLTKDPFLLGVVGFAGQFPVVLLGLLGGLAADRMDRRRLLMWTQLSAMIPTLALAFLTLTGTVQVWHIIALAVALGVITAFDMPARQSFVFDLVTREELTNAIALNSTMVNGSRMVGPAVAGIIVGIWGEGVCFLVNAVSYLALLLALVAMQLDRRLVDEKPLEAWHSMKEGLRYVVNHKQMRAQLLLMGAISFLGVPFMVLLPIFASEVLGRGAEGLGLLSAATGLGAVAGAIWLAGRDGARGLQKVIGVAAAVFGVALGCFAVSRDFTASLFLMALAGGAMMMSFAGSNTMLQVLTSDNMRGRVMSLFSMTFMGIAPLGSLAAGALARRIGAPDTVAAGALACIVAAAAYGYSVSHEDEGTREHA